MKVNLRNIDKESFEGEFVLRLEKSAKVGEALPSLTGSASCRVLIRKSFGNYRFLGKLEGEAEKPCDYCLETGRVDIAGSFDLLLIHDPDRRDAGGEIREIVMDETDTVLFSDFEIETTDFFEDQILLDLPSVILCRENCKGLCSRCGENLNFSSCVCAGEATETSHPFRILQSALNKN